MKRKTVDTMREIRLWVVQIGVPLFGIVMAVPELRDPALKKCKSVKESIEKKLNR